MMISRDKVLRYLNYNFSVNYFTDEIQSLIWNFRQPVFREGRKSMIGNPDNDDEPDP